MSKQDMVEVHISGEATVELSRFIIIPRAKFEELDAGLEAGRKTPEYKAAMEFFEEKLYCREGIVDMDDLWINEFEISDENPDTEGVQP